MVLPVPERLSRDISVAMRGMVEATNRQAAYANAFWSKDTTGENSLIVFASEYKTSESTRNKNQLGMDFGAAQSQRRALGLDSAIVWGATYAEGCFEVFSSEWENDVQFSLLSTHHVTHYFSGYRICTSSPLEFARPGRFHEVLFVPLYPCGYHSHFATEVRRSGPEKSRPICCLLPLARDYSASYRWTEKT